MFNTSVSDSKSRYDKNMFCDNDRSNELSSNSDLKSHVGVINSSNCVINIDYLMQEEKISFEVFRSSLESNCLFRKRFSLRKSRSCIQLNSTEKIQLHDCKVNKMVQTEANGIIPPQVLAPSNLGPPPPFFRSCRNEYPVRDTPNFAEIIHKESYGVSNFKFPENANVVKHQHSNFCSLDFDGTRSRKKRIKKSIIVKRVRSDINIKRPEEITTSELTGHVTTVHTAYNLDKFPGLKNHIVREVTEEKHKKRKHRGFENASDTTVKLKRKDRAIFEFVLTPKEEKNTKKKKSEERHKPKHRKIIVTSNTLQLSHKPNMKNVELQTNMSDFIHLKEESSLNELFVKRDFRVPSGDHSLISRDKDLKMAKKKPKKKKMTMTILPCMEVKDSHLPYLEMPVPQKRVPIPRRRIDEKEISNPQTPQSPKKQDNTRSVGHKRQELRNKSFNESVKDEDKLKEKIESLFKDNFPSKNPEYNKKIDELCSLINSLVKEKENSQNRSRSTSRSRSQSRSRISEKNKLNSTEPEPLLKENKIDSPKEQKKAKVDKFKITHNEKDSVSIQSEDYSKQNIIPRNVLKISPRINEMLKTTEFKRKNTMVTYPSCIMPELPKKENELNINSKDSHIVSSKLKEPKMFQKKSSETKRNCSSVTFSSQISIIGDDSHLFNNDVNVKNTLFSISENTERKSDESLLKRSKTLPTKQEFSKPASGNSNATDLISSMSNSDIGSVRDQRQIKTARAKKTTEKSKAAKPGAIENSNYLFSSKLKSTNNTFQKRKEYYNNLKLKKIKPKTETDSGRQSETKAESNVASNVTSVTSNIASNAASKTSLHENIPSDTSKNEAQALSNTISITESGSENKSDKSKVSLLKQQSKKEVSPKKIILKSRKDNNLFPYEFSIKDLAGTTRKKDNIEKEDTSSKQARTCSFLNSYPLEKPDPRKLPLIKHPTVMSPHNVDDVKQQISTFLHSYPLEIPATQITSPRSPTTSLSIKNNVPSTFPETFSSLYELQHTSENLTSEDSENSSSTLETTFEQNLQEKKIISPDKSVKQNQKSFYSSQINKPTLVSIFRAPENVSKTNSSKISFMSMTVTKENTYKIDKKSKLPVKTKQISENKQFVYYSSNPITETQISQEDEDTVCELGKLCRHICCLDSGTKGSSEFHMKSKTKSGKNSNNSPSLGSSKHKKHVKIQEKKSDTKQINENISPAVYIQDMSGYDTFKPELHSTATNHQQHENLDYDPLFDSSVSGKQHSPQESLKYDQFKPHYHSSIQKNRLSDTRKRNSHQDDFNSQHLPSGKRYSRQEPYSSDTTRRHSRQKDLPYANLTPKEYTPNYEDFIPKYHSTFTDTRYIHEQPESTWADIGKICKHICCGDTRPIRESASEKLVHLKEQKDQDKTFPSNIEYKPAGPTIIRPGPTIIRPVPVNKTPQIIYFAQKDVPSTSKQIGENNSRYFQENLNHDKHCCCHDHSIKIKTRATKSKVDINKYLIPHKIKTISREKLLSRSDTFPSSHYKLPLKFRKSRKPKCKLIIHPSNFAELARDISDLSAHNELEVTFDSVMLIPKKDVKRIRKSRRKKTDCDDTGNSKDISEIPVDVILSKSKTIYHSACSESDTVIQNKNSKEICSSELNISIKRSVSNRYFKLLKFDSLTNFLRKKTTAIKKIIITNKKDK